MTDPHEVFRTVPRDQRAEYARLMRGTLAVQERDLARTSRRIVRDSWILAFAEHWSYRLHPITVRVRCAWLWATRRKTRMTLTDANGLDLGDTVAIGTAATLGDTYVVVWKRGNRVTVVRA